MIKVNNIQTCGLPVNASDIPNGIYDAKWSAYEVVFDTPIGKLKASTSVGVRGINCKAKVKVENGEISLS